MKTKLVCMVMLLICGETFAITGGAGAIKGNSMTSLGDYVLALSDSPLVIDGMTFETYCLTYKNTKRPICIGIESKKKCSNFIVKGPSFELEYICKRGVFGAKHINPIYRQIDENMNDVVINEKELEAQRVISVTPKTEDELLGLIACYLPMLIKEEFRDQI